MTPKALVVAVLYALAEMRYGPDAPKCEVGIHARHGLMVAIPGHWK